MGKQPGWLVEAEACAELGPLVGLACELAEQAPSGAKVDPCDFAPMHCSEPSPSENPYPGSPNYSPSVPSDTMGSGFYSLGSHGTSPKSPDGPTNHGDRQHPTTHPKPPPPPRDPCAHMHCVVPPHPVGLPHIALPVSLTAVAGAVAVTEDLALDFGAWVLDGVVTGVTDLLGTDSDPAPEPEPEPGPGMGDGTTVSGKRQQDPCRNGSMTSPNGHITYGTLEQAPGMPAGVCRATGTVGDLDKSDIVKGKRPSLNFDLPGQDMLPYGVSKKGNPYSQGSRGHLMAFIYGGSNKDLRNFIPLYQPANQAMYDLVEDEVYANLDAGGTVHLQVTPVWGVNPVIPAGIEMDASGGVSKHCIISNSLTPVWDCR